MSKRSKKSLLQDPIRAEISSLSHDGRGIARINGKTTFIFGALPGEEVLFTYTRQHSKFDEGQVQQVLKAAPERVAPACPHFGVCGGCSLQHMQGDAQIRFKQEVLLEQLQHIGQVQPENILAPLTGPLWEYRHKGRLSVKYVYKKNKVLVGFRELDARFIADLQTCSVLHASIGKKIVLLSALIEKLETKEHIPQIEIAIGGTTTALIIRHLLPLTRIDEQHLREFAATHYMHIYLQAKGPDSISKFWPEDDYPFLTYELEKYQLTLQFRPTDFTQVNPIINQSMIEQALKLLDLKPTDTVLDLYCGLGNFTLPMARFSQKVIGVEGSMAMVEQACNNASTNKIQNVEFYCADLMANDYNAPWAQQKYDKILLDPPRTGARELIEYMPNFQAKRIVYVSCNPATLARDAGELIKQGYRLKAVGVMDMFPHTSHVESIACFESS
jgi:23S rRNA (uracil1939-C5)-methyltransferase